MVFYKVCIGGIIHSMRCSIGNSIGHYARYSIGYSVTSIQAVV